jgi:hypothetical protein
MEKMTRKQYSCLKRINWDYNISIEDMFAVINGEKSHAEHLPGICLAGYRILPQSGQWEASDSCG